jgi:apolipoprotein N-acyltransferase
VWWLFISMHRYGGLPRLAGGRGGAAAGRVLSLYLARRRRPTRAGAVARPGTPLLFAALWLLAELARGLWFTGFPWVASGYAQVDSPLAALAPWVGVYGMGAVLAAARRAAGARWSRRPGQRPLGRPVGGGRAVGAALGLPGGFTRPAGEMSVAVAADQRQPGREVRRRAHAADPGLGGPRTGGCPADLVVAPETAVPLLPDQLERLRAGLLGALKAALRAVPGRAALVGMPLGDFDRGYTNSVVGLSAQRHRAYRYDKWHLVPFGEFIPRGFRWFTDLMNIPLGDFARGVLNPPSFAAAGQRVAPNICYEDLFGEELARVLSTRRWPRRCSPTSATSAGSATAAPSPST